MPKDPQQADKSLHSVVDKLLKQLPGADPTLRGDPSPSMGITTGPRPRPGQVVGGVRPAGARGPTPGQIAGLWGMMLLGVAVGVGMLAWPYAHACGFPLFAYLGAVTAVLLLGGWTAVTAWRYRVAAVHAIALVITFWGIVLAAEQLLPRIGYARTSATWSCTGTE